MNTSLTFHQWREWTRINQPFSLSQTCFSLHLRLCGGQLISGGFGSACMAMWSTKREKGDPSFYPVLSCSWQSRASVNSERQKESWKEQEERGSFMQRAPSASIPALEKRVASCCCWAFFPGFNRDLVKGAPDRVAECGERKWGMEVSEERNEEKGRGTSGGSNWE